MQLSLRELLNRLPRYLVMVNPTKMRGEAGEWIDLGAHETVLEALRACSGYMAQSKYDMGFQLTSSEADPSIEPWIVVVDRVENSTVVWVTDSQLHVAEGVLQEAEFRPDEKTDRLPSQLLQQVAAARAREQGPTLEAAARN